MKIISIISEKGGVGKTTTAYNLAGALACSYNKKVCVVDFDPQQNLSQAFNAESDNLPTIAEMIYSESMDFPILKDEDMQLVIRHTDYGVDYCPARKKLLAQLPTLLGTEAVDCLTRTINNAIFADYDYIIFDCKNSLENYLVPQILTIADYSVIITECGQFSFYGIVPVMDLIKSVKTVNPKHQLAGIVINKSPANIGIAKIIKDALADGFENIIFKTIIPYRLGQTENSTSEQKPCCIARYNGRKNTLGDVYNSLAEEFIERTSGEKND